jgi:hypothetical protein
MFKTVSKPLAHLNFLSGVNCYDIGSTYSSLPGTGGAMGVTPRCHCVSGRFAAAIVAAENADQGDCEAQLVEK